MKLASLLLSCLLVGCGSESTTPTTSSDAATTDTATSGAEDTATGTNDAPVVEGASFGDVYDKVLKASCSSGYCHGGGQGGWTFSDRAATYADLVGPASSRCSGLKKVEPGQPEKSSLYLKMRGSFAGVCTGNKMPSSGDATPAQLEMVRSWIAAGAKP